MVQFMRGKVATCLWDVGDDAKVGNSKRKIAGDPKGWKRKREVKNRLALSHEQIENKTGRIKEENSGKKDERDSKEIDRKETESRADLHCKVASSKQKD